MHLHLEVGLCSLIKRGYTIPKASEKHFILAICTSWCSRTLKFLRSLRSVHGRRSLCVHLKHHFMNMNPSSSKLSQCFHVLQSLCCLKMSTEITKKTVSLCCSLTTCMYLLDNFAENLPVSVAHGQFLTFPCKYTRSNCPPLGLSDILLWAYKSSSRNDEYFWNVY